MTKRQAKKFGGSDVTRPDADQIRKMIEEGVSLHKIEAEMDYAELSDQARPKKRGRVLSLLMSIAHRLKLKSREKSAVKQPGRENCV